MKVYPKTAGLLSSMMLRWDHGVFMPRAACAFFSDGPKLADAYKDASDRYDRMAANGPGDDHQLYEEMTGRGFYSPDREDWYKNMFNAALRDEREWLNGGRDKAIEADREWQQSLKERHLDDFEDEIPNTPLWFPDKRS